MVSVVNVSPGVRPFDLHLEIRRPIGLIKQRVKRDRGEGLHYAGGSPSERPAIDCPFLIFN